MDRDKFGSSRGGAASDSKRSTRGNSSTRQLPTPSSLPVQQHHSKSKLVSLSEKPRASIVASTKGRLPRPPSAPPPPQTATQPRRSSSSSVVGIRPNSRLVQRNSNPIPASSANCSRQDALAIAIHTDKESVRTSADKKQSLQQPDISEPSQANNPASGATTVSAAKKFQQLFASTPRIHRRHTSSVAQTTTKTSASTSNPTNPPSPDRGASGKSSSRASLPHASTFSSSASPPPKKRAPARFSSNGVATSSGPPPSLAFRRIDNRISRSSPSPTPLSKPNKVDSKSINISKKSTTSNTTVTALQLVAGGSKQFSRPSSRSSTTMDRRSSNIYDDLDDEYGERDRTIRGLEDLTHGGGGVSLQSSCVDDNQDEDVFLKLARTDSISRDKLERRQARIAQRNSVPTAVLATPARKKTIDFSSSPPRTSEDTWRRYADNNLSSPATFRSRRKSAASEHFADRTSLTPRASFGIRPQSLLRREQSAPDPRNFSAADSNLPVRASEIGTRTLNASPHIHEGPRSNVIDGELASGGARGGFESNADSSSSNSTNAASSVWDELDDLKSRIRRLEVTGRMPAVGGGNSSNSSGERPRTATTTVTTVSSSPRHGANGISPVDSTFEGIPTNNASHPLLHVALGKSKPLLPVEVYKHLELAAKDALDMSNALGTPGSGVPSIGGNDRMLRRKADNMCRSITELCLALSEHPIIIIPPPPVAKAPVPAHHNPIQSHFDARPFSRAAGIGGRESVMTGRESVVPGRETSLGERLGSRTTGRFAERKNSNTSLSMAAGYCSPRAARGNEPIGSPSTLTTIRQRNSMNMKDDYDSRLRAGSRATTEAFSHAHPRSSREFSPMELNSSFALRRTYPPASGVHASPLGPSPRSHRYIPANTDKPADILERVVPVNERLANVISAPPDYSTLRKSIGRTQSRRTRGLRDSVEFDGGGLGSRRLELAAPTASERLLRR